MTMETVELETGLTAEIDGWLALTAPGLATLLEVSRQKYVEHTHRKTCARVVNMYRKAHPMMAVVDGSNVGRPIYLVMDNPQGPDEVSIPEIFTAMDSQDPKGSLLTLLNAKRVFGGGRLTDPMPVE